MRVYIVIVLFIVAATLCAQQNNPEITSEELKDIVYYLADDTLKGRKPGTETGYMAGDFIKKQVSYDGISFLAEDGFQYFDIVTGLSLGENNKLAIAGINLKLEEEYTPMNLSANKSLNANMAFVGYGFSIDADNLKWDDYAGVDVKDKIVVLLRGKPAFEDTTFLFEDNSSLWKKVITAKDKGAAGVLFVSGKQFDYDDSLVKLRIQRSSSDAGVPVAHLKRSVLNKLLSELDVTVEELEAVYENKKAPFSFDVGVEAEFNVELNVVKKKARNVIAYLEGSDLKDEVVVIGAHYDHLGFGGPGSGSRQPDSIGIHNGADDNGSGTAAAIEIFEKFALVNNNRRSIMFTAFDAEEMGLLGSKYLAENLPVKGKKIVYMANLDMIGRMDKEARDFTLGGTGTAKELPEIINKYKEKYNLHPSFSPEGLGPSDHASFYSIDVPVTFVFTGVHPDYHTPADDRELVHYDELTDLSRYMFDIISDVVNRDSILTFTEAGPKEREDSGRRSFKVSLGIMPDFSGTTDKGLKVDAVMKDRPAEKAGVKKGDIIIEFNGKKVANIYEYMERLSEMKTGQKTIIKVLRDEKEVELEVQF